MCVDWNNLCRVLLNAMCAHLNVNKQYVIDYKYYVS